MFARLKNNLYLWRFFRSRAVRKLPLKILWQFWRLMQREKVTKFNGQIMINYFLPPFPSSSFERYLKNLLHIYHKKEFLPKDLIISLTNRCPYHCGYCYNEYTKGVDLAWPEIKKVIDYFNHLGIFKIGLSGGEPLLRDDLEKIIKYIVDRGISVTLSTTGYGLDKKRAVSLKKSGLTSIQISLDHYQEETGDGKEQEQKSLPIAIEGLKASIEAGLYASASLTVTNQTAKDDFFNKYVDFVESLGVPEIRAFEIKPTGRIVAQAGTEKFLSQEQRKKIIAWQRTVNDDPTRKIRVFMHNYYEDKNFLGCQAGVNYFYIDADGNVRPCVFSALSLGNIKTEGLDKICLRFKKYFSYPRTTCLAFDSHQAIINNFNGELPLPREISETILENTPKTGLPNFYKKIMDNTFF